MAESWRPRQSQGERVGRHLLSMQPGAVGGRIAQARPMPQERPQDDGGDEIIEVPFSYHGLPVTGEESPAYFNRTPNADVGTIIATTRSTTTGSTVIRVWAGAAQISFTLPSGVAQSAEHLVEDVTLNYGDRISVQCTSVGAGLSGLVVQVLLTGD